jgi:DNA-binding NarL/FixJ family response regulator
MFSKGLHTIERTRRVLVVDPLISSAELLSLLLNREGYSVVAEASTPDEALSAYERFRPELVISEAQFPTQSGADFLEQLVSHPSHPQVFVYSGTANDELVRRVLRLPVQGLVHKGETLTILRQAISTISRNASFFSPYANRCLREPSSTSAPNLSARERAILQMIATGSSSKNIASQLFLSPKTVEHYRKNLMRKLKLDSISAVTLCAVRLGLVEV